MISVCKSSRDRALIAVQYEAATRIGEIGRLQWRDVVWDEYGAKIRINDEKTRKIRFARLTQGISSKYLAMWRDDYPNDPNGENFVFISGRGEFLTYGSILKIFKVAGECAGIKKRINTHLFTKSRGTHLIEQGLPIANVVELMWGNQNTQQIRTYIRMSPMEQDRVLLKHAGVISEEENKAKERRISGKICLNCHTQNSPTARYCSVCGIGLTDEELMKQEIIDQYLKRPDVQRKVYERMLKS